MKSFFKIIPWLFVALFGTEIVAVLAPKKEGEFHTREFGRLPVLMNGRIQPFDSVARNSLLQIRSTADVPVEMVTNHLGRLELPPSWKFWHHPKKLKSTNWLLELMFLPEQADERAVFLIHHPELLSELNLQDSGVEKSGLRYYTMNQVRPVIHVIWEQATQARKIKEDSQRTPLQKQVIKLQNALYLYQNLRAAVKPVEWDDFAKELKQFEAVMPAGVAAMQARESGTAYDTNVFNQFAQVVMPAFKLKDDSSAGQFYPLVVPPRKGESHDDWGNIWAGLMDSVREREIFPPVKYLAGIASGYGQSNAGQFNEAVAGYKTWLAQRFTKECKKGREEYFYNDTKAFLHAMIIYTFAFVLAGAALLACSVTPNLSEALRRSAFYLIILAGIVHTFGLCFRMYLEGRPPVTNLYSSAIFIGWGAMVLGLVLERIYRLGIGNIVASCAGFLTLLIAHNLALGGDTMEMMRAVLDTNFWLATHVVVVTLGYASTFVAGLLAILYIVLGVVTKLISQKLNARTAVGATRPQKGGPASLPASSSMDLGTALSKMVYGIVCFATLFSFTGTVLGGIWADQSWGRFWGWDPKENGALIIVLWNATILHARWGGIIRARGLMNMAVFGNIVTSFSWFGVNMLNIGLHSYGFMDAAFVWLLIFVGSQMAIIGLGLLPLNLWKSFRTSTPSSNSGTGGGARIPAPSRA